LQEALHTQIRKEALRSVVEEAGGAWRDDEFGGLGTLQERKILQPTTLVMLEHVENIAIGRGYLPEDLEYLEKRLGHAPIPWM
jgi:hypothetical protein